MPRLDRRVRSAQLVTRIALCEILFLQPLLAAGQAVAHPTHPGRWTGTMSWNGTAVNLVLLPGGSSGYHSRVLWWDHDNEHPVAGNVYGWQVPDDATTNDGAFPTSNFTSLTLEDPPDYEGGPSNIFCAGQTLLADGKLLVTGGTSIGEAGNRSGLLFDPAADANGQWSRIDHMGFRRWYSNNTLLPDGRAVTASGSAYLHFVTLGGLADAATDTATRMLQRVGVDGPAELEPSVVPLQSIAPKIPIDPFSDAMVASVGTPQMLVYGGKDGTGSPASDAYVVSRHRNPFGLDYIFDWTRLGQSATKPLARYGATLVALGNLNNFVLIGGRDEDEIFPVAWRGTVTNNSIIWTQLQNHSATPMPSVHGLSAVYDVTTKRVFLFGGSNSTASDAATNSDVHSLELGVGATSDTLFVTLATATGANPPGPRSYASLTNDRRVRLGMPGDVTTNHSRALLFGGYDSQGSYSDALHSMWVKSATEVVWEAISPDGEPRPSGRARHAAALDGNTEWLVVYGGETESGKSAADGWRFDLTCGGSFNRCDLYGNDHWEPLPALALPIRGAAAASFGQEAAFSRFPEVYTPGAPASQHWTTLTNAPHWQEWFPFGFAAPRKTLDPPNMFRVFYAGPELRSPILKVTGTTGEWEQIDSTGTGWFFAGSAVMYRPGKVMKCGTRDTRGWEPAHVLGSTSVIDLNAANPAWVDAVPADSMIHRRNHNLVILPTGEVAVIGGARWGENTVSTDANCVKMPQIWNPDTLAAGHWYGQEPNGIRFEPNPIRRHYHSTAVLLPDGRILSAGGSSDHTHQVLANLYSPYYLFNANGTPRARPEIQSAPTTVSYGERFALHLTSGGPAVTKVALLRPGATTHGFDQNQRFVQPTIEALQAGPSGPRVLVHAPTDSAAAPPGDYMLFALDAAGTPSIARWVRLRATNGATGQPTAVLNLAKICSQGDHVSLQWLPPSVDSATAAQFPGPAAQYDLRYRTGTMPDWAEFATATPVPGLPTPADPVPAVPQSITATGLTPNSQYTFRLISKNFKTGNSRWSALSNVLTFTTVVEECGGAGGGGGGGGHEEDPLIAETALTAGMEGSAPVGTSATGYLENTLFANVRPATASIDVVRLPYGPRWSPTAARVRLSRGGTHSTRFTSVRLRGVALAPGQSAFVAGSSILAGTLAAPLRISHSDGHDLTGSLAADKPFEGHSGDMVEIEFADPSAGRIAIETSGSQLTSESNRTGIELQFESSSGWQVAARHDPRALRATALYDVPSTARVRLVFKGDHLLHGVARFEPGPPVSPVQLEPSAITHSRLGESGADIGNRGLLLASGDHAFVDFEVPAEQRSGLDWFLEVAGEHVAITNTNAVLAQDGDTEAKPTEFALRQNQPNPFGQETLFAFEVPRRAKVRLEVFDLAGRRVATLASAVYDPGRHSVAWDRRGPSGRVPAGVYTYRLTAEGRQFKRQMVVLP